MYRLPTCAALMFLLAALSGNTYAASVSVQPSTANFGSANVGEFATLNFTTTFSNYSPLDFAGVDFLLTTGTQFSVLNDSCDILGCAFQVRFAPTSSGSKLDTLTVKLLLNGGTFSTGTSALTGTGLAPVPAPAALPLLLTGLAALGLRRSRQRRLSRAHPPG